MPHRLGFGLILVGGCFFSADYRPGTVTCREGPCPDGLTCIDKVCVIPIDAGPPDMPDMIDGPPPALTCADPGTITLGATLDGDTSDALNLVSAACGGFSNVGRDDVYKLDIPSGTQITLTITNSFQRAYVIAPCVQFPTSCLGNARAAQGVPITVTTTARPSFIVVDNETATAGGAYTLHVQ